MRRRKFYQSMPEKSAHCKNIIISKLHPPEHITRMTSDNIETVKKIEIECGLSPWTLNDYEEEIKRKDSIILISQNKNIITGFVVARLIMQKDSQLGFKNEAEIYNIAVKKEFRKKGIAQALINRLLRRAKINKVSKIWLEVRESNYPAINFYRKNNFSVTGTRKNFYYSPVENAIAMCLNLSDVKCI